MQVCRRRPWLWGQTDTVVASCSSTNWASNPYLGRYTHLLATGLIHAMMFGRDVYCYCSDQLAAERVIPGRLNAELPIGLRVWTELAFHITPIISGDWQKQYNLELISRWSHWLLLLLGSEAKTPYSLNIFVFRACDWRWQMCVCVPTFEATSLGRVKLLKQLFHCDQLCVWRVWSLFTAAFNVLSIWPFVPP